MYSIMMHIVWAGGSFSTTATVTDIEDIKWYLRDFPITDVNDFLLRVEKTGEEKKYFDYFIEQGDVMVREGIEIKIVKL